MSSSTKNPLEIIQLFQSDNITDREKAYRAFLERCHWNADNSTTPEDLKLLACKQLNVRPQEVFANVKLLEPALLWASQDGLESAKLKMVEAAAHYSKTISVRIPPVVVWDFFDSQSMRKILHDGHHRTFYHARIGRRVKAIVLEPIGNYHILEDKFRYAFQIRKRVIDLPVSRTRTFSIVTK
ncbi:MAG: hypothetical protein ACTSWW_07435 [Promethearchaeota archaeon]